MNPADVRDVMGMILISDGAGGHTLAVVSQTGTVKPLPDR